MIMRRHERSDSPNVHVTHEIHGRNDTNACKNDYEKYFFMRMPPNMSYHAMAWIYHAARLDRVWFVKVSNLSYTYAIQKIQKVWSIYRLHKPETTTQYCGLRSVCVVEVCGTLVPLYTLTVTNVPQTSNMFLDVPACNLVPTPPPRELSRESK